MRFIVLSISGVQNFLFAPPQFHLAALLRSVPASIACAEHLHTEGKDTERTQVAPSMFDGSCLPMVSWHPTRQVL